MTAAICIKCGAMKVGAFTPCPKCRFTPESPQDQARSILLSDRNLDASTLEEKAQRIHRGETLNFDESAVAQMASEFEELRKHVPPRPVGCLIFQWTLIVILVLLVIAVVCLYWYVHHGR